MNPEQVLSLEECQDLLNLGCKKLSVDQLLEIAKSVIFYELKKLEAKMEDPLI